ncbi:MAG: hypothetical protein MUF34_02935 [Polyangiaceae bacterium]|jgi:hypothetical protein|nr:hypothetical protein [Polyangiaceae bacterium]
MPRPIPIPPHSPLWVLALGLLCAAGEGCAPAAEVDASIGARAEALDVPVKGNVGRCTSLSLANFDSARIKAAGERDFYDYGHDPSTLECVEQTSSHPLTEEYVLWREGDDYFFAEPFWQHVPELTVKFESVVQTADEITFYAFENTLPFDSGTPICGWYAVASDVGGGGWLEVRASRSTGAIAIERFCGYNVTMGCTTFTQYQHTLSDALQGAAACPVH